MEYGKFHQRDTFSTPRVFEYDSAYLAAYFHPIIRRMSYGEVVSEYHVLDNLENSWTDPKYKEVVERYLERSLATPPENLKLMANTGKRGLFMPAKAAW